MDWIQAAPAAVLLFLAIAVYTAPTLWKLGVSDSMYHMEHMTLLPSQETWIRQQSGDADAWLDPSMRGVPRIRKPPMVIWLHMLAWSGLDADTVDPAVTTYRARLVAWGLGLMGILSTAWIGRMIYSHWVGARAALILAATYSVLKQSRMATFDTHLLGWVTLALALSLAFARRRVTGAHIAWLVMGSIASAAAFLTKGAVAVVYLIPFLVLIAVFTSNERIRTVNLFLPVFIGAGVYGLWLWDVLATVPGASDILSDESTQGRLNPQPVYYYVILLGLIFPWTLPFLGVCSRIRSWNWPATVPWLSLAAGILILTIPDNRRQRYLIPLMPMFALGLSHLWSLRSGKWMLTWNRLHVLLLILLSSALAVLIPFQATLVETGVLKEMEFPGADLQTSILLGILLIPLCGGMIWSAFLRRTCALIPLTACWIAIVYTLGMHYYVHSYHGVYEHRAVSEQVHEDTKGNPGQLFYMVRRGFGIPAPDERFLYHSGRFFHPVPTNTKMESGAFVLIPAQQENVFPTNWSVVNRYQARRAYTLLQVP